MARSPNAGLSCSGGAHGGAKLGTVDPVFSEVLEDREFVGLRWQSGKPRGVDRVVYRPVLRDACHSGSIAPVFDPALLTVFATKPRADS